MPCDISVLNHFKSWLKGALCIFALLLGTPVHAQSVATEGGIVITYPYAGDVLAGSSDTIFFSPRGLNIHQWRVTVGTSPETSGIYDSDVRNFHSEPWELVITGLPVDGRPLTVRFWQRIKDGEWFFTEIDFNAAKSDSQPAQAQTKAPEPVSESSGAVSQQPSQAKTQVAVNNTSQVKSLKALHRNGQTFLTWTESGDSSYHVYRHTAPITASNIQSAEKLTQKWGPLGADTSVNKHAHGTVPTTYVISDLGQPLSTQQGLFVHTAQNSSNAFYAVTTVVNGSESLSLSSGENTLAKAVAESVLPTKPVLTLSMNRGKGRLYTQYMDYSKWNPTFNGYAYNYTVALPAGFRASRSYPLLVAPHAYGEDFAIVDQAQYGWQVIQLFPDDPGFNQGALHSWWYGYAADHNYQTNGPVPSSGVIENFTQQRVMMAIEDLIQDPEIKIDTSLIHAYGHSMGASGSLTYGIQYPNVFAGMYGSEAMTNYRTSPKFQEDFERLWGSQAANLPIVNRGPYSDSNRRFDGTGVWDWMNHQKQLVQRRGDRMAYLMIAQGKADTIIDWPTQGEPMARVFNEAKAGFSARFEGGAGHSWLGFSAIVHSLFGFGNGDQFNWRYPRELSYPSIQYASGSGSLTPGVVEQTDLYNLDIEWATEHTWFDKEIVDKPGLYEITLRTTSKGEQVAHITPKNTQRFVPQPGTVCQWKTIDRNWRRTLGKGSVTVDDRGLVTVENVRIKGSNGTRVFIDCR